MTIDREATLASNEIATREQIARLAQELQEALARPTVIHVAAGGKVKIKGDPLLQTALARILDLATPGRRANPTLDAIVTVAHAALVQAGVR